MKKNIVLIMTLALASLVFMGESCVTKDTEVDVPVRTDLDMPFQVRTVAPQTEFTGVVTFNLADEITNALDEVDVDSLVSVNIESGYWRITEDYDNSGQLINGSLTAKRVATGQSEVLLDLPLTSVSSLLGPFHVAPLETDGVALLNAAFAEYLDWMQNGGNVPNMNFEFTWFVAADSAPLEFDWEARIRLSVVGTVTIEVPEVL